MKRIGDLFAAVLLTVSIVWASTLFSPTTMTTQTSPAPYVITASSAFSDDPCPALPTPCGLSGFGPETAFNALSGHAWTGMHSQVDYLKLDIGAANGLWILTDYKFTETSATRAPNTWTVQCSPDDITYTIQDSRSGITWTPTQTKSFNVNAGANTPCRYFRFNTTMTNGDATFTEVLALEYNGTLQVGGVRHRIIR